MPPTVRVDERVRYREGRVAFMHCRARGIPTPTVGWLVDGEPAQGVNVRYSVLNEGTLRISDLRRSDAGTYQCMATNEGGDIRGNTTLEVLCESLVCRNVKF